MKDTSENSLKDCMRSYRRSREDQGESSRRQSKRPRPTRGPPLVVPQHVVPEDHVLLSNDVSNGLENYPIRVYGPSTRRVPEFRYLTNMEYEDNLEELDYHADECCQCDKGGCDFAKGEYCHRCGAFNSCEPYLKTQVPHSVGRLFCSAPLFFECHPGCQCTTENCLLKTSYEENRKGALELFFTGPHKGWGVRSSSEIKQGEAVCEYLGVMRKVQNNTDPNLDDSGSLYAMNIDGVSRLVANHTNEALHDVYGFKILLDSLEKNKKHIHFTVDAANSGNLSRFINHSCDPNLFVQCIAYPHKDHLYQACLRSRLIFFAMKDIFANEELTFDYNTEGPNQVSCRCGSTFCKKVIAF